MEIKFEIWEQDIRKHQAEINGGQPFITAVRDQSMAWNRVEAIVSRQPGTDAAPAAVLCDSGQVKDKGEWFIRVLKTLPDED